MGRKIKEGGVWLTTIAMVVKGGFMVFHGFWLVSMVFQGGFMVFHGFWLVSMFFKVVLWFSWFLVGFHGFSRWFHGFHGFWLVSMVFQGGFVVFNCFCCCCSCFCWYCCGV